MSCNNTGNANTSVIGMRKESTYLTPIHTTFDAGELVNPVFANSYESNLEGNKGFSKSHNGQRGMSAADATKGLNVRSLTITGDLKQNGYGFIKESFQQESAYVTDHMEFKDEDANNNCVAGTYTFWIPEINNGVESGERLAGCIPLTLDEDLVVGTFTAVYTPSTRTALTVANTIPTYPTDYNVDALSFPNFNKSTGKLVFGGNILQTSSLTTNITYTLDDANSGFYDENGDRNDFKIEGQETTISYTSPLSDAVTANNISKTLLDDRENNTSRSLEVRIVEDATTKVVTTFDSIAQGEVSERAGSGLYTFTCDFKPVLNSGTSLTTSVYDGYGDITAEL
jgi:hypothetical protein